MTTLTRPRITLIALLAAIVVAAVSTYLFLSSARFERWVCSFAENQLNSALPGDFSVDSVCLARFPEVSAYGVSMRPPGTREPAIFVGRARVRVRLLSLIRQKVILRYVRLENAHVIYDQARPNLVDVFVDPALIDSTPPPGWPVFINRITATNVGFEYRDTVAAVFVEVAGGRIEGKLEETSRVFCSVHAAHCRVRAQETVQEIDTVFAKVRITEFDGALDTVIAAVGAMRLEGAARMGWAPPLMTTVEATVSADSVGRAELEALGLDSVGAGPTVVHLSLSGPVEAPAMKCNARIGGLRYTRYSIRELDAEAMFENGLLDASAQVVDPVARGTVKYSLDTHAGLHEAQVSLASISLARLGSLFGVEGLSGTGSVRAQARASGLDGMPERLSASVAVESFRFNSGGAIDAGAEVELSGSRWTAKGFVGSNNPFSGEGTVGTDTTVEGRVVLRITNLPPLVALWRKEPIEGLLTATLDISGTLAKPSLAISLACDTLTWHGFAADTLAAEVRFRNGRLYVERLDAAVGGGLAGALGTFGVEDAAGRFRAAVGANGPLDSLRAWAWANGAQLRVSGFELDTLSTRVDFADSVLTITNAAVGKDSVSGEAGGRIVFGQTFSAGLSVHLAKIDGTRSRDAGSMVLHFERTGDSLRGDVSLDKAKLSAFHPWLPIARPPFGTADAHIVVSGTAANPDVALDLDVHSLGFTDSRKARVAGSGTLRDSLASAVCTLTVQDLPSPLLVQARVPFVPSAGWRVDSSALEPATVSLRGRDIDLGTLVRAYTADASADGSADLDLLLTYTNGLWVPSGMLHTEGVGLVYYPASVTVSNLSVTLDIVPEQANEMLFRVTTDSVHTEYGSVLRSRWDGRLTPNSLRLDSSWVMVDGGGLRLSAAIPFVSPDSLLFHEDLAVSVRSRHFPVVFFNGFSEELEFRDGYIQGSASLRAGRSRFSLDGALKTKDLRVVIPTMAPPLGPVSAEFVFAGDSVSVHSLRAQWGENGSLAGRGAARLTSEGLRNIHMELAGRRLPLNYEDLVEGVVDSVVIVITSGNGQQLGIEGLVTLGETQYEQIVNLAVKQPQPEKPDSSLRDIALDLKLDINRNLTVLIDFMQYVGQTSISTNAKLDGFFAVSGTAFEPILDGEIRVTEGKIIYLDRTFKVESGLVKQTRQRAVNPAVNFVAKTAVRNLSKPDTDEKDTVTLIIRGDLNDPQILLICGGYSETQIIALLTFGRPDLASSIDQTTLGDRAGVLATQQFFGLIERRLNIEGVLGLEELSVEGNIAELGNARVSASKSLGERVRISYTGRVGDREEQRAVVSWELLPFLFLEGGASADGTTGIDAKVRFTR